MYLSKNENNFDVHKIEICGEQTSNAVVKFKINKEFNGIDLSASISVSDFIQQVKVLDSFSVDVTVESGYASLVLPFSILNALQSSTYSIQATLSYNGKIISQQAIIVKKGN